MFIDSSCHKSRGICHSTGRRLQGGRSGWAGGAESQWGSCAGGHSLRMMLDPLGKSSRKMVLIQISDFFLPKCRITFEQRKGSVGYDSSYNIHVDLFQVPTWGAVAQDGRAPQLNPPHQQPSTSTWWAKTTWKWRSLWWPNSRTLLDSMDP